MTRLRIWLRRAAFAACGTVLVSSMPTRAAQPRSSNVAAYDLAAFVHDRNADGVPDAVDARVALGEAPAPAEIAAAADLAARLGFETSAMDLPLTGSTSGHVIAIGAAGARRAGISAINVADLASGQGRVTVHEVGGRAVIVAAGADPAGTRAAATMLASRLPHLGDIKGPSLHTIVGDIEKVLAAQRVHPTSVRIAAAVAAADAAIQRLDVEVEVPPASMVAATKALRAANVADAAVKLSYDAVASLRVSVRAPGMTPATIDLRRLAPPDAAAGGRRPGAGAKENLDLSSLYTPDGLLGDADTNLIPDRLDTLLVPNGEHTARTIDLAARLGLESAGVVLPIAAPADAVKRPEGEPSLVLIGLSHPIVDKLIADKKFERPTLAPGEGLIHVVRKAFGEKSAVIVTGGDAAGLARALEQVSERFPHVWARGRDRTTLDDVEEQVRRFVAQRTPAGQAAGALYVLDQIAAQLQGRRLASASVIVSVAKADEGLKGYIEEHLKGRFGGASIALEIDERDVQRARTIFAEDIAIPSEVDDFWKAFDARVVPAVRKNAPATIEVRLSEPPEVRERLAREIREKLAARGAAPIDVRVLSAYKQGYSWLYDRVRPQLAGAPVAAITIRFAELAPPPEWPQQAMFAPTRWLMELFPIADVLARDLKMDLKQIRFEKAPIGSPTYQVIATASDGREILREVFEPKVVLRPFMERFPEYEKVRVTTGWLSANVGGRTVADERIATDPERFWDHYQQKMLPRIYDYAMRVGRGKPEPEDAPFFGELTVDLTLSEPEYQLGIDQEQIASMEALHEEIYFHTLHFFDVLGRHSRGRPLDYPGRVIPIVRPKSDGKAGRALITFTGFAASRPSVIVKFREAGGREGEVRRDLRPIAVERPSAMSAYVRAGRDGLERLDVRVKVDSQNDEREALLVRARTERVDEQIVSAERVTGVLGHLQRMRGRGLYADALAFHDLRGLRIVSGWTHDVDTAQQHAAAFDANGRPLPWPDIRGLLSGDYRHQGESLVQWDTPIPPGEAYAVLAKMSTFPEATVYRVGESYLGKDVWAMDLMPPVRATHWSQAKQTTWKPTVVYSARQHANEVSSTSHVLKLAEKLLTDATFRDKLKRVNVVIHPITNADGAQLAYDLQKITPNHMLHAGYLGSLGVDVTNAQWDADPIYPESRIRADIWRTWLPDIFLNPHGYPSHEWVQLFSEYAGWVRNRVTEARDWWGMRGWFTPGFGYLDDPKFPRHKEAAFELRRRIAAAINAAPEVRALNERAYDRYRRYGFAHDSENFKLDFTDGVLMYTALKGARSSAQAADFLARQPKITIWTGSTEAPDETARGDWMKLVATAGLQWDTAILDYLVDGAHKVDRKVETFAGGAALSLDRPRPPKPPDTDRTRTSTSESVR